MPGHTYQVLKGSSSGKIVMSESYSGELMADEVMVRITHAGLCGTDLHYQSKDIVLGQEGVGVEVEVGSAVRALKAGNRAGWGYLHNSCLCRDKCFSANEIFCEARELYSETDTDQGGFRSHAIWKAAFLFHIPDIIPSLHAAPLMCAGSTVFNAMEMHGVHPTEHLGTEQSISRQRWAAMDVVVFSGTPEKEAEAKALGATEFHNVKPVKRLYVTTSVMPNWEEFTRVLAPCAVIYPMTLAHDDFTSPYIPIPLLSKGQSKGQSVPHGAYMLCFVAQHKVGPVMQQFPLTVEGTEEATKKLDDGEVRCRAVLVVETRA
ncbi:NADP-dependent alcohol dehydrogenase [Gyrodon lividus]|nr:NADP-dependent alcohol dehydrogenase [Gyrodon lividus]